MNPIGLDATAVLLIVAFALVVLSFVPRPASGFLLRLGCAVGFAVLAWNSAAIAW